MEASEGREMPRYKCHKEVWALKIKELRSTATPEQESDGSALMVPAEDGYAPMKLDAAYMRKHRPQIGGYFVQYADGYRSFSPAQTFEEGYAPMGGKQ